MSYFKFIVLLTLTPSSQRSLCPSLLVVRGDPEHSGWGESRVKYDNKLFHLITIHYFPLNMNYRLGFLSFCYTGRAQTSGLKSVA